MASPSTPDPLPTPRDPVTGDYLASLRFEKLKTAEDVEAILRFYNISMEHFQKCLKTEEERQAKEKEKNKETSEAEEQKEEEREEEQDENLIVCPLQAAP